MTRGRRFSGFTLACCLLCSKASFAQAAPTEETSEADGTAEEVPPAEAAFRQAEKAFAEGNYGDAARAFDLADSLAPHASVIFNAAVAWDHAGDSPRAATNYKRALGREGLTETQIAEAEKRLADLGQRLVYVHLNRPVGATISVAHLQDQLVPTRFFLEPGTYELVLEDGPLRRVEELTVARGRNARFEFEPLKARAAPEPPSPPVVPRPPPAQEPSAAQEIGGWVLLGVGVLAAGAAVYLGSEAVDARTAFLASSKTDKAQHSRAFDLRLGSNIATGSAGVLGATGVVLLLTAPTIQF